PPPLGPAGADDGIVITAYEPDEIRLKTTSTAPGMVVLSEVYYPAWHASVDGQPAPVYRADDALRAVAIPAGDHVLELRIESAALVAGMVISSATVATLAGLALYTLLRQSA